MKVADTGLLRTTLPCAVDRWVASGALALTAGALLTIHYHAGFSWLGSVMSALLMSKLLIADRYRRTTNYEAFPERLRVCALVPLHNEDPAFAVAAVRSLVSQTRRIDRIHVVDDGSSDGGLAVEAVRRHLEEHGEGRDWEVTVLPVNRGKRHALATGFRADPHADIFLCIDSDTVLDADAVEHGLRPFADAQVAAVAGVVSAYNWRRNVLTRLIDLRYLSAFLGERAAYSAFGAVLCCCGSLSFYRGAVVRKNLDDFLHQRFLGQVATSGDDRRLTNYALRTGKVVFAERSRAATAVPERFTHYLRQQVRWNKSFFRESLWVLATFPLTNTAFWLTAAEVVVGGWLGAALIGGAILLPVLGEPQHIFVLLAFVPLAAWMRSTSHLEYRRDGVGLRDRLAVFALAPLYGVLHLCVLMPLRLYSLFTLKRAVWGTRSQVEVRLDSVSVSTRPRPSAVRNGMNHLGVRSSKRRTFGPATGFVGIVAIGLGTLALTANASSAQANQPAQLRVTVVDQSGAAIPKAVVRVTQETDRVAEATSDEHGVATAAGLAAGAAQLHVEFDGFAPHDGTLTLHGGNNNRTIILGLSRLHEEIIVTDVRAARNTRGNSMGLVLEEEDVGDLSAHPEEMQSQLEALGGGVGAVFRVNGFRGGRLPGRGEIRQIRFRTNSLAAENHESGQVQVEIITRPALTTWSGSTNLGLRSDVLSARNVFARTSTPGQVRRFAVGLRGPILKNRTSLRMYGDGNRSYDTGTVTALTPTGPVTDQVRRPLAQTSITVGVEHGLTKYTLMRFEYRNSEDRRGNLGVGEFNLADRAYRRRSTEQQVRASVESVVGRSGLNEFRAQWNTRESLSESATAAPTVIVIDAFNSGGAGISSTVRATTFEAADNYDFAVRKHAMRVGMLLEAGRYRKVDARNAAGTFTFRSLDAFLAGTPNTYTQRLAPADTDFNQYQLGLFWQDDLELRPALSLNLGMRYEVQSHIEGRLNVMPRLGVTWNPSESKTTTVRVGYGTFYDWYEANLYEQTLGADGVSQPNLLILNPGYPDPYSGPSATVLTSGRVQSAPNLRMPTVHQGFLGIEKAFTPALNAQASYLSIRGRNQMRSVNINAPDASGVRPESGVGSVTQIESAGRLESDRLNVTVTYRVARRRVFLSGNYTLARVRNHVDNPLTLPANSLDPNAEWAPGAQDIRHRLNATANFPVWYGLRASISSNTQSAPPYTITTGSDDNRDGVSNDRPPGVGRHSARGAARIELSARLTKVMGIGGNRGTSGGRGVAAANPRFNVEFYAQAFNLLNHPNYLTFSGNILSPFFGRPTSAAQARRVEVGSQFRF